MERFSPEAAGDRCLFDALLDDLVIIILGKLSTTAGCAADFINVLFTCKRLNRLALSSDVLSKASPNLFAVEAEKWSETALRRLKFFVDAGNPGACYTLGMIQFYCLEDRESGISLMERAADNSHAPALYSLAVIQFNGSGGSNDDRNLSAGVNFCARAASLGHIGALRELGHCYQDGRGVAKNTTKARRFVGEAYAREFAAMRASRPVIGTHHPHSNPFSNGRINGEGSPLLSDPSNRFLADWFAGRGGSPRRGLKLCSRVGCGRPETRLLEFGLCRDCGNVCYCSRACQADDWRLRHKAECKRIEQWFGMDAEENEVVVDVDGNRLDVDAEENEVVVDGNRLDVDAEENEVVVDGNRLDMDAEKIDLLVEDELFAISSFEH